MSLTFFTFVRTLTKSSSNSPFPCCGCTKTKPLLASPGGDCDHNYRVISGLLGSQSSNVLVCTIASYARAWSLKVWEYSFPHFCHLPFCYLFIWNTIYIRQSNTLPLPLTSNDELTGSRCKSPRGLNIHITRYANDKDLNSKSWCYFSEWSSTNQT